MQPVTMNSEPALNYHHNLGAAGNVPPYQGLQNYHHQVTGMPGADHGAGVNMMQPNADVGAYGMPPHPNDAYHHQQSATAQYDHHLAHHQQPQFDQHQADFMQHSLHHQSLDAGSQQAHQQQPIGMGATSDPHAVGQNTAAVASSSTQSYNAPTYDELFPALPESDRPGQGQTGAWSSTGPSVLSSAAMNPMHAAVTSNSMPSNISRPGRTATQMPALKSTTITQIFRVPPEERKYRDLNRGLEQVEQNKICADIMAKTGTHIEISNSKDGTLTFLITGKEDAVQKAKRQIAAELQQEASGSVNIPKEYHRFILGKGGKKLAELEASTGTKIYVPRQTDENNVIKIIGTRDGIDRAIHEIKLTAEEAQSRSIERVLIPKIYHPFIAGPYNQTANEIMQETGAKINIPPPNVLKDEISITGDRDGVQAAKERIQKIYHEKERKCATISLEVKKPQHKYIVGPRGQTLQEIFQRTGVSVEMPPTESDSETITLRGDSDKLGPALTVLYEKAHSEIDDELQAPQWMHRYILGPKGKRFQELADHRFPKVTVSFTDDRIKMHGPREEVLTAKEVLDQEVEEIRKRIYIDEMRVNPKYHRFLIGKKGATISEIREKTGAQIHVPSESGADGGAPTDIIRIEGSPQGVAKARQELEAIVSKLIEKENEVSKDLIIESRFHKLLIGTKGEKIREIREKFNQVVITFPEPGVKSDKVTIRGNKPDVEAAYKYLSQQHKELLSQNYRLEVPIFKQFHKFIIGKDGSNIKKIREETSTKIDLPLEESESNAIVITGRKENVELAEKKIKQIQDELANVVQTDIIIPAKLHNSIIGAKGRQIKALMEECGGVNIKFPDPGSGSEKVSIRGPKDCVAKAKKRLVELASEKEKTSFTAEIKARPEHHRFLIGKNGANIRKVREQTGAQIFFPSEDEKSDPDRETIVIQGRKEDVLKAKAELEAQLKELEKVVEEQVKIPLKHHKHFVARRGAILKEIQDDCGGVTISFPRASDKASPNPNGSPSEMVTIKGIREGVASAKQRLLDIVNELENQVTIECVIEQQHHRTVMGPKGSNVQRITDEFRVQIKFPERATGNNQGSNDSSSTSSHSPQVNGNSNAGSEQSEQNDNAVMDRVNGRSKNKDVILIHGLKENCLRAKEALLALVPITEEMQVPFDYHRFIIGQKGSEVRDLMDRFRVNIAVPPADQHSDTIRIHGPPENVRHTREAIEAKIRQLDDEKQDRIARSFSITINVDPALHPKIIGRQGKVISKIREKHQVQIQFPEAGSSRNSAVSDHDDNGAGGGARGSDEIKIVGYEKNVMAARDAILNKVKEYEGQVTEEVEIEPRIHPRLIGSKGRAIKKVMEMFKVDIRFPRSNSKDRPEIVTITGDEDAVDRAKDHLLNLAEEYMDDLATQYIAPPRKVPEHNEVNNKRSGFVVKGAPWEGAPNMLDESAFPSMPLGGETQSTRTNSPYAQVSNSTSTTNVSSPSAGAWGSRR